MESDKRRPVVKAREVVNIDDDVSLAGTNKCHAISVDDYPYPEEEEVDRNLHLAIMASLSNQNPPTATAASSSYSRNSNRTTGQRNPFFIDQYPTIATAASSSSNGSIRSRQRKPLFIDLDNYDNDDVEVLLQPPFIFNSKRSATGKSKRPASIIEIEIGDPSTAAATFMCEICVETKPCSEMFLVMGCTHSYCSECMVRYVRSRLQDNITQIHCPLAGSGSGCHGLLEPEHCRPILPPEVFDRWGSALCEAAILASDKFYCPFKDCSALLIMDSDNDNVNVLLQSECPNCRRLFCVQCKVPWHSGIECQEFQNLNKDEREREDIMLMQLAKNNRWMRCPKCRFYVEKSMGCLYMRCRCGYTFCYNCGAPLTSHYCISCKR